METKITEVTRRDIRDLIFRDLIFFERVDLYGRLTEIEFLSRIWNLESMPSFDGRFNNAEQDIWQHTVNNNDWPIDWVFDDERFDLIKGDDETFLRFLCETIHPVVRKDVTESEKLCQIYNKHLKNDGY